MASTGEDGAVDTAENESAKGPKRRESKKRKFKPFSAMRRLFSGGKGSKRAASVSDEDHVPTSAADSSQSSPQNRQAESQPGAVSEDNAALQTANSPTVSDPSHPQSAFKAELVRKLSKRRSMSEEDEQSDSCQGQAPHLTVTDTSAEDSIREDLFDSQWTSSLTASAQPARGADSHESPEPLDVCTMVRADLLRSDAAKDRISVKPRARKTNWASRKKRENRYSLSLPSLEESPGREGRPQSEYIDPTVLSDFNMNLAPSAVSALELTGSQSKGGNYSVTTTTTAAAIRTKPANTSSTTEQPPPENSGILATNGKGQTSPQSGRTHRVSFVTRPSDKAAAADRPATAPDPAPVSQLIATSPVITIPPQGKGAETVHVSVEKTVTASTTTTTTTTTTVGRAADPQATTPAAPVTSTAGDRREGLRQADSSLGDAFSPRPDYKLRRQQRSKTLPVQHAAVTVQRTGSQKGDRPPAYGKHASEKQPQTSGESAEEPEWVALARRKTQRHNEESESTSTPSAERARKTSLEPGPSLTLGTSGAKSATLPRAQSVPKAPEADGTVIVTYVASAGLTAAVQQRQSDDKGVGKGEEGVKTFPDPTHLTASSRPASVRVTNVKSQPGTGYTPSASSKLPDTTVSSSSSSSAPAPALSVGGELKASQPTSANNTNKVRTQSTKTLPPSSSSSASSTLSSSSSSSFFSSSSTRTTPPANTMSSPRPSFRLPATATVTKTDSRPVSSVQMRSPSRSPTLAEKRSSAPAWQTEGVQRTLLPRDVRIELIEDTPGALQSKVKAAEPPREAVTKEQGEKSGEQKADRWRTSVPTRRNSKVMDLLKTFENLQGVS
ncbi:uncharacterized protein LOC143284108 [Babylonia areolata]|uniref:uncharacterized protein LOC143284108 n=1 Tax=Babylonia areolata TaxID=304850 RepID=UPI003FD61A2C